MLTHYFTDNRQLPQERKTIEFHFWGFTVLFVTDNGVFSKDKVDFGSELLLRHLDLEHMQGSMLDVGCGYGVIGTCVALACQDAQVHMIDVNDRAIELANLNAQANKTTALAFKSHAFENVEDDYNHIITNPPIRAGKAVVYEIFEGAYEHLKPGGVLWVVIRKQQGAPSAIKKIESIFNNCTIVAKDKGYYILKAIKVIDF